MKKNYLLESEDVVQICTALEFWIHTHRQTKDVLLKLREKRIWSDEEVQLFNKCTETIESMQTVYNKFRS